MITSNHIAISLDDISDWCRKNNTRINEGFRIYFENLNKLIKLQVLTKIPIFTVYLLPDIEKPADEYLNFCDLMADFCDNLAKDNIVSEQKIKITIFGKWYKLPGKTVEAIKNLIETTKDYDNFFVNLCINYDGQEEIVDACKLIAKQVQLGKIGPEMITRGSIKENIYSSYFLAPDIVIIYGERRFSGILLWDSAKSYVAFADKSFMEFDAEDFEKLKPQPI